MSLFEHTPELLFVCLVGVLLGSFGALVLSRRVSGVSSRYFNFSLLFLLLVALAISMKSIGDHSFQPHSWVRGWIWPKENAGSIVLGILESGFGLLLAMIATLSACSVILCFELDSYGAFTLSTAGTVMALVSATPFMVLIGASLGVMGQYLSFAERTSATSEPHFIIRLARDKWIGLAIASLGLLALHAETGNSIWGEALTAIPVGTWTQILATVLIGSGFFIYNGSFPVLGGFGKLSHVSFATRLFQSALFPGLITWTLFLREAPLLSQIHMNATLGLLALVLSVFSAFCGLLQPQIQTTLLCWVSSGVLIGVSILSTTGATEGTSWILAVFLASTALFGSFAVCVEDEKEKVQTRSDSKSNWHRVGIIAAVLCGCGAPGFVGAAALAHWMSEALNSPGFFALVILSGFLSSMLLVKVSFLLFRRPLQMKVQWQCVLMPLLFSLLGLGAIWTGTASSGLISGNPDQFWSSLLDSLQGAESTYSSTPGVAFYLITLAFASSLAYFGWGSGKHIEARWDDHSPKLIRHLRSGMGSDWFFTGLSRGLQSFSERIDHWTYQKFTKNWLHKCFSVGASRTGAVIFGMSTELTEGLSSAVRVASETPGKALQLIQSGNLQWYLLFAIGSGLAMLLHFLRN